MRRRQRRMRGNLPGPEGLARRGASAALRGLSVVPPRPAPRALHPLPLLANAAHAEYSDRLLGRATGFQVDSLRVDPTGFARNRTLKHRLTRINAAANPRRVAMAQFPIMNPSERPNTYDGCRMRRNKPARSSAVTA